jgi:hypothetical protein
VKKTLQSFLPNDGSEDAPFAGKELTFFRRYFCDIPPPSHPENETKMLE